LETELQLLNDVLDGDSGAQRRLYERLAGAAMATALRYVPDHDEVRDVVQESFIKILTRIGHFHYRGEGSLRAWAMTIVVHEALNHLRAREHLLLTDRLPDNVAEEPEPDVERVPPDVLTRLIGQLPAGYRVVLNLYVFEQLSHKEIGQLLGIKPQSSASQYFRAKQMLAKIIRNYLNDNKQ